MSKPTHQAARSYLFQRHSNGFGINPHKFAAASAETGSSFDDLMKFISRLYAGGAQQSTFRQQDLSAATGASA
jgi:hypothetical protein